MDPLTISALIGAGSSIFGGILGNKAKDDNIKAQQAMAAQNIALQKEFAQSGIQWKVADAKKAGIHPIYGLGASTQSFSPVSISSDSSSPLGDAVTRAGQDVGRAVTAMGSREERAIQMSAAKLDLEGKQINNDIARAELASRLAKMAQPGTPPPFPTIVTPNGAGGGTAVKPDDKRQGTNWFGANAAVGNVPDAQVIQNRYGEPAEWLYFPFVAGTDAVVNAWPHISRFIDYSGLGTPVSDASWMSTRDKFGRYMDYIRGR